MYFLDVEAAFRAYHIPKLFALNEKLTTGQYIDLK